MKNSDILDAIASLNEISKLKQPVKSSFNIGLNIKAVKNYMEVYDAQRKKIVDKHTKKDADGKVLPVYHPAVDAEGKSILTAEGDPILDAEGKPLLDKDGKPPKEIEGQVRILDAKAFQEEIKELNELEITDAVLPIRKIKISSLEGSVEPMHFANLHWMIIDDSEESSKAEAKDASKKK